MAKAGRDKRPHQPTAADWNNPFATLAANGLPAGEEPASPPLTSAATSSAGRVVLRRETAHRGGKPVIVVDDFPPRYGLGEIEELARRLKKACGAGGTVKGRTIEIQGDQTARVRAELERAGFRVAGVR